MSIAHSYANALYEAAIELVPSGQNLDIIEAQVYQFQTLLESSNEARVALVSPLATAREKVAIVEEFSKFLNFSPLVVRFLVLLAKKNRYRFFKQICQAFTTVRLSLEGGIAGTLVSAEAMNESDISILANAFSQKLGKKVVFQVSSEPSLLAGLKVTVNGVTYDGTLRSQIQKLRDYFVAGLPGAHV